MNIARWAVALFITLMIPGLLVTGAYAMTVTAGTGQVQTGAVTQIPVVIDQSPVNMGYYNITVSMSDPTVARITRVTFPGWANWLIHNSSVPSGSVYFLSTAFSANSLMPATDDLTLATLTVEGLKSGTISINVDKAYLQWDGGSGNANLQAGTLQVGGTAPTTTSISVSSTPTGATVYLDGTAIGSTPVTIPSVSYGTHTLLLTKTGYQDSSNTATVSAGSNTFAYALTATPVETTTSITVSSTPTGASVYLDGTVRGATPLTIASVPYGTHTLLLTKTGYQESSNTVTVSASTNTFAYVLTATPVPTVTTGQVYFSTTPQGAAIIIDGVPANAVTPNIMNVPVGTHHAVFRLSGYNDLQASFTSQKGSMTSVSRRLSPGSGVITTTTGTPVVTTTVTTTITTVPTSVQPTTPGSWTSRIKWPTWFSRYLPTGWR